MPVFPLDLNYMNRPDAIGTYLITHSTGAVLVECGPGATLDGLQAGLREHGLTVKDVTHALVTHIHLDHAGAAGWLARQGAQICVHPVGAPHLSNPEKLLGSARRIYGEGMDSQWGEFLPVPEEKLTAVQDGEEVVIGNLHFTALHTPGHAEHHIVYILEETAFTGDIGGVRLPGAPFLILPMPPPELNLEKWRASLLRLQQAGIRRVAPTHFGIYDDADWHLRAIGEYLDAAERWAETEMPDDPPIEILRERFIAWLRERGRAAGLGEKDWRVYEIANPAWMSADGLQRYWKKYRA